MKTTFFLLMSCTIIEILTCELIEIKSQTAENMVYRNYSDDFNHTGIFEDSKDLNSNVVHWPITKFYQNENRPSHLKSSEALPNFIPLPVMRMPKSFYASRNLPTARNPEGIQIIPIKSPMYRGNGETSLTQNETISSHKKSNEEDGYEIGTTTIFKERNLPLVSKLLSRRTDHRRNNGHNDGESYLGYQENLHYPEEDYASPEIYSSSQNYDPEGSNKFLQRYSDQNGRYGSENYNSYSSENYKNNLYYENVADSYPRTTSYPKSIYSSEFTHYPSYDDPARGGPPLSLTAIFFAIGSNLLKIFKIALGSGLSLLIPLIAIKFFLIPLKIFKFIKIVKIILKLFFLVPFILRVFAPSIYSAIGQHNSEFSNKMSEITTPESREIVDQNNENSTSWSGFLSDMLKDQKCTKKVACELGSYLASKTKLPEKFIHFFVDDNFKRSNDFDDGNNENEEVSMAFLKALTQHWTYDRCNIFACGISL